MAIQHPEIKAHNEHAARTNDPMIPKNKIGRAHV